MSEEKKKKYSSETDRWTFIRKDQLAVLLFNSFRYCLGRKTYAVSEFTEILAQEWKELPKKYKDLIKKEIRTAIATGNAGMDMDVQEWQQILDLPQPPAAKE